MEKEIYRIKKGNLISKEYQISIDFGIISSINGFYLIEMYVNENFKLEDIMKVNDQKYWGDEFHLYCQTEENNLLEIDNLYFKKIQPSISKIQMECYGKLKHTKIKDNNSIPIHDKISKDQDYLYYLTIEGMRMEFSDITLKEIKRNDKIINEFNNASRDHTSFYINTNEKKYQLIFSKSSDSEEIIVEFHDEYPNRLTYSNFCKIKNNFISLLSLINGAEIKIRKECIGSYYSIGKIDSEIVFTYSYEKVNNRRFNNYIPINNPFNRRDKILNTFFLNCFDNYESWNNKIDLNSIVFYLVNSEQTKSLEEKVFIQMIAFERLTTLYANNFGAKEIFEPSKEEYKIIKDELLKVIDKYQTQFGDSYNTVKSKIGNLNQIKRLSTTDKMYKIIKDVQIEITDDIENLIDNCRHETIHIGKIGDGDEALENSYLLDELLREIILRLIRYDGPRYSYKLLKTR